jgi:hypothetical protein
VALKVFARLVDTLYQRSHPVELAALKAFATQADTVFQRSRSADLILLVVPAIQADTAFQNYSLNAVAAGAYSDQSAFVVLACSVRLID